MLVPRLTTKRLVLRGHQRADFERYAQCLALPDAPGGPVDRRNAWRGFAASTGTWVLDGAGWWAIELAETREYVGTVGAFYREPNPDRDTPPEQLEVGWMILPEFRRRGFASEAAAAAVGYGFDTLAAKRIIAVIDPGNDPSIRVSQHIGMRHERKVTFYGKELDLYSTSTNVGRLATPPSSAM